MVTTLGWQWQEQQGQRWLTCDLLAAWPHSFGSSQTYPRRADQLAPVQLGLPEEQAAWAGQVHEDTVLWMDEDSAVALTDQDRPDADAIATAADGVSVWVRSADCVPVLIAHPDSVCAIHSGWRGTAVEIVPKSIQTMVARGIDVAQLKLAIGPAISGPVYQVSQEVADQVLVTVSAPIHADVPPLTYPDSEPAKTRLDLRAVIVQQAIAAGVSPDNISISPHCTFSDATDFFSYRRLQNPPSPVQWSGIGLSPKS